ncbi:hypothetical protein EV182_000501 [Spiromyces aspiralis]|uniref:Uncharacterized protein n=1 Tax=Spiromyces aspiralis TaxID=68401 RepID=A0ACC1HV45_9FUNG|nr:hypothetical protein EV182_000501 [Spiromyces aspiralis]
MGVPAVIRKKSDQYHQKIHKRGQGKQQKKKRAEDSDGDNEIEAVKTEKPSQQRLVVVLLPIAY